MSIISFPAGGEIIILGIFAIYWVFIITTLVSIFKRPDLTLTHCLLWTTIILIAPVIGMLLYFFFGQAPSRQV
jgi:hypothetical protein